MAPAHFSPSFAHRYFHGPPCSYLNNNSPLTRSTTPATCRGIVARLNATVSTSGVACTPSAVGKSCFELGFLTPRLGPYVADAALCCGCSLADVLAGAPEAAFMTSYITLLKAYSARVIATFSSRGPTVDGRIKPDITAPGVYTVSAMSTAVLDGSAPVAPGKYNCGVGGTMTVVASGPFAFSNVIIGAGGLPYFDFFISAAEAVSFESVTLSILPAGPGTGNASQVVLFMGSTLAPFAAPTGNNGTEVTWQVMAGPGLSTRNYARLRFAPVSPAEYFVVQANTSAMPVGGGVPPVAACWGTHSGNIGLTIVSVRSSDSSAPPGTLRHNYLQPMSGTSMATPAVAGNAVLVRQMFTE